MKIRLPAFPCGRPRLLSALIALCAAALCAGRASAGGTDVAGPFLVGSRTVTVTRGDGSTFQAVVRYPAAAAGASTPFDPAAAPAPAVTFGHGFLSPVSLYESTLSHLASWGMVAIATTSQGGPFPSHAAFAADMRDCLTHLAQQSGAAGSWLEGRIDTTAFGASGHSMGGGASVLAAAADPRIVAVANLAAAETNPSARAAMELVQAPVRIIAGSQDTIVSAASTELIHDSAPGPRQFALIEGGSHCGFIDSSIIFCDNGSIARAEQLRLTRILLTDFFLAHLRRDGAMASAAWVAPSVDGVSIDRNPRAAVTVTPGSVTAAGGSPVAATVVVANTGSVPSAFALSAEAGAGVPVSFATPVTESLAPGASASVPCIITVPSGGSASRTLTVLARRLADGVTLASAAVQVTRTGPAADLTGDGNVNAADLTTLLAAWGPCTPGAACPCDLDGNGNVNGQDLAFLVASWTS